MDYDSIVETGTPEGLNPSVEADAYFKFTGFTNPDNNVIFKVMSIIDSDTFTVNTLDDTPTLVDSSVNDVAIRTHPINSPSALLVDSAGTASGNENGGGVTAELSTNIGINAQDELVFSYAYDGNTQKDRVAGTDVAINVRYDWSE